MKPMRDGARMVRAIPRIRRNLSVHMRSWATQVHSGGDAFDNENAALLASNNMTHWWFRSKATFVSLLIRRFSPTDGWLVDIGAGPGGVTAMIGWDPDHSMALERNIRLALETKRRGAVQAVAGDASRLPIVHQTANVVCLLDVIEHLSDPVPAIREAARILTRERKLIINVPAHPRLWSSADEVLGHAKRYTRRSLSKEIRAEWVQSCLVFPCVQLALPARVAPTPVAAIEHAPARTRRRLAHDRTPEHVAHPIGMVHRLSRSALLRNLCAVRRHARRQHQSRTVRGVVSW